MLSLWRLPHSGRPMDDFMAALATLETDLSPFARRGHPLILLGDFNVDLALDAGERCVALKAFLRALGLTFFSADRCPTWRHRRLDYMVCNRLVVDRCCGIGDPLVCPWAVVTVCTEAQRALGVDHGLLLHELLLSHVHGVPVGRVGRAARRAAFLDRPCKMRVCNRFLLQQQVYAYLDAASSNNGPDPHCFLSHRAATCCAPALVFRYQDSPGLRALCRARSLPSDPAERRRLSFEIHVCRKAEKKRWKLSLLLPLLGTGGPVVSCSARLTKLPSSPRGWPIDLAAVKRLSPMSRPILTNALGVNMVLHFLSSFYLIRSLTSPVQKWPVPLAH